MNKKIFMFLIAGIFGVMLVTAGLVSYLSNTETATANIGSPTTIDGSQFTVDISYAGEDSFELVKITNHLDYDITGDVVLTINPDEEGISVAITDDINYCFSGQGDMTGVTDCETDYMTWLANNIDWNDWYANEAYNEDVFRSTLVVNQDGDSFHAVGYTDNQLILPGMNLPSGDVYGLIYISTDIALTPDTYNFDLVVNNPTA